MQVPRRSGKFSGTVWTPGRLSGTVWESPVGAQAVLVTSQTLSESPTVAPTVNESA
ncbi:hypothetical protein DPMN_097227 [Dreissena polymorpha]|uniref:Uncharacterized protein n=1 Tax=Dreissena polymorpha TaxID=45954 RepID=A0A9D4LBC3_DREPO|nr:hypothetical protein DPMN_097227 [Dreissena polymorpha]